jgi:hypothetical protein
MEHAGKDQVITTISLFQIVIQKQLSCDSERMVCQPTTITMVGVAASGEKRTLRKHCSNLHKFLIS